MFKKAILPLALMMASGAASAGIITNESELITGSDHAQLSEWLGSDFDLTRIFAKGVDGDTSQDWHAAVDGQGATFTIIELIDKNTNERNVIGGYNGVSWNSEGLFTSSSTSFLFNLSDDLLFEKNESSPNGADSTFNHSAYGATFGMGYDLRIYGDLTTGHSNLGRTYGDTSQYGSASYREEFTGFYYSSWRVGAYETYALSDSTVDFDSGANAVLPESGLPNDVPAPFALAGFSLLGLFLTKRKSLA